MGCINVKADKTGEHIRASLFKKNLCKVSISKILNAFTVSLFALPCIAIKAALDKNDVEISINRVDTIHVSASLVCTVQYSDEIEMWWCDGWKVLWNNRIKALWQED